MIVISLIPPYRRVWIELFDLTYWEVATWIGRMSCISHLSYSNSFLNHLLDVVLLFRFCLYQFGHLVLRIFFFWSAVAARSTLYRTVTLVVYRSFNRCETSSVLWRKLYFFTNHTLVIAIWINQLVWFWLLHYLNRALGFIAQFILIQTWLLAIPKGFVNLQWELTFALGSFREVECFVCRVLILQKAHQFSCSHALFFRCNFWWLAEIT